MARALTVVAEGGHPDIAKPLNGFGSGMLERALRHRGDAFRVVSALQSGSDIRIVHAFQKKSTRNLSVRKAGEPTSTAAFSRIRRAKIGRFTVDRLMTILDRMGQQVEGTIRTRPRRQKAPAPARPAA